MGRCYELLKRNKDTDIQVYVLGDAIKNKDTKIQGQNKDTNI